MKDHELLAKALEHRSVKAQAGRIFDRARRLQDDILAELTRRGSKVTTSKNNVIPGFAARGVKIMRLAQPTVTYDPALAATVVKPSVLRKLLRPSIPKDAVEEALAAGLVTAEQIEAFTVRTESGAYVRTYGDLAA